MSVTLRIEDRQGAMRPIDLIDGNLKLVRGSRQQLVLPDGMLQDTMRLFIRASASSIRETLARLYGMLNSDAGVFIGANNPAYLVEASDGESPKRSRILAYYLLPYNDYINDDLLTAGAAMYDLTLTRMPHYEQPRNVSKSWTATIGGSNTGDVDLLIPKKLEGGDVPGRVSVLSVQPKDSARVKTMWFGMKPRYGVVSTDLSTFNPLVRIGSSNADLSTDASIFGQNESPLYYTDYIGNECVKIDFATDTGWRQRASIPLLRWNTSINATTSWQYAGRYRVLLRWASKLPGETGIENADNVRYGVRLAYAYGPNAERTELAPIYPAPAWDGIWNWSELGEIVVGGEGWTYDQQLRERLDNFTLSLDVAHLSSNSGSIHNFFVDGLMLIPAEHFLRVTVKNEFDTSKRVTVYTGENGAVTGFVSEANTWTEVLPNAAGGGVGVQAPALAAIHERVSDIEVSEGWGVPSRGGRWVIVCDRDDEHIQAKGATALVSLQAVPRARLFYG